MTQKNLNEYPVQDCKPVGSVNISGIYIEGIISYPHMLKFMVYTV
jgi:hypothetical protein